MARGVSNEPRPVILPEDEGRSKEEQSVFWVKPRKAATIDKTFADYRRAVKTQTRGNFEEHDPDRLLQADKKAWLRTVHHIDNFFFSEDHAEKYWTEKDRKAGDQRKGVNIDAGDTEGLMAVFSDLLDVQIAHIVGSAADVDEALTPTERKKNRGSVTLGDVHPGKPGE